MIIPLYVDPDYSGSVWCVQTVLAVQKEAVRKGYCLRQLRSFPPSEAEMAELFPKDQPRLLLILTTSVTRSAALTEFFSARDVRLLFINFPSEDIRGASNIAADYYDSMRIITEYLQLCGCRKTALYGINPNSSTDRIKERYFTEHDVLLPPQKPDGNIYYNRCVSGGESSALACFEEFLGHIRAYDSVICANDPIAYSLICNLSRHSIRVPEDLYVVSFGDWILSRIGRPTLTTVSVNHGELGRQAVLAYAYLCRAAVRMTMNARIPASLIVRESTGGCTPELRGGCDAAHTVVAEGFSHDPEIGRFAALENMLTQCDAADLRILEALIRRESYAQISEELFMAENSVAYRVRRLCRLASLDSRSELTARIRPMFSPEAMRQYRKMFEPG